MQPEANQSMAATAGADNPRLAHVYSQQELSLISICFVLSGATGLIYEVIWARMLGLVFGVTTLAIGALLAAFMGGLALGSALAARFASRIARLVRAYAFIEIAIGLYALAVPLLFRLLDRIFAAVWLRFHPGFYGFAAWRFALAATVLLIPTALMGATLPVLAGALGSRRQGISPRTLYAGNLTSAIAGTITHGSFRWSL